MYNIYTFISLDFVDCLLIAQHLDMAAGPGTK